MIFRRIALLAVIAAVTLMTAGSAAAEANGPIWTWGGVPVGGVTEKVTKIPISGWVADNDKNNVQLHPCAWSGTRSIWNSLGVGVGEVEAATFATPCKTSIVGCTVQTATAKNLPWSTKLFYVGTAIWDEVKLTYSITFDKGTACTKIGLGGVTSTYTGRVTNQWTASTKCEIGTKEELENQAGEKVEAEFEACSSGTEIGAA